MNRRNLLKILAGSSPLLLGNSLKGLEESYYSELPPEDKSVQNLRILPRGLIKGKSKIAITATSSAVSQYEMREALNFFKQEGFDYVIGETVKADNNYRYLSASDDIRAKEFMQFIEDDTIDCIMGGRGGYGVLRILEKLDFEKIRKNPKIIIGYSDITALINPIYEFTGLITYHGPVANSTFNNFTIEHLKQVLYSSNTFKPIEITDPNCIVINDGVAEGNLIGGNLRMIASLFGTPYQPKLENCILFLEDVSEPAYKIDRMLSQLILSGKLDRCKGIIFGQFDNLNKRQPFYPGYSYTILEVIKQLLGNRKIPIMVGMPFGHIKDKLTLPIGINAKIDTNNRSLTLLERSVI